MLLNHFSLDDQKKLLLVTFFNVHHFQMIKQKAYLLLENLDQVSDLNIVFVYIFFILIDIYSS